MAVPHLRDFRYVRLLLQCGHFMAKRTGSYAHYARWNHCQ